MRHGLGQQQRSADIHCHGLVEIARSQFLDADLIEMRRAVDHNPGHITKQLHGSRPQAHAFVGVRQIGTNDLAPHAEGTGEVAGFTCLAFGAVVVDCDVASVLRQ